MSTFRFAIMGAGNIAHQFCDAVTLVEDCEVSAIASKDLGRAQKFAEECSVAQAYDNYEQMLIEEKPDCVYICLLYTSQRTGHRNGFRCGSLYFL